MTHWRTSREAVGGDQPLGSHYAQGTPRDYVNKFFPSKSIWAEPLESSLPRSKFTQALFDVFAIGFAFLFLSITAVSVVAAGFILLFVAR